jgi:DNA-directed RNA polymerase subunit RPC12/RpoP
MTMENARQVPCPSCSKPLYKQGPIDFAASIFGSADDFPTIVSHEQGDFLRCQSCSMFVLMQRLAVPASGLGFEIHPSRKFFARIPEGK